MLNGSIIETNSNPSLTETKESLVMDTLKEILTAPTEELSKLKKTSETDEEIDPHNHQLHIQIDGTIRDTVNTLINLLEQGDVLVLDNKIKEKIRQHPFFELSGKSGDSAMHAFTKPYGYAGDMHLMRKICEKENEGTNYEKLTNLCFLNFITAEAVRQRAKSLFETLKKLPNGSKVVNLACGPALEVQGFLEVSDKDIEFILLDNDLNTLEYLEKQNMDSRVKIIEANAFKLSSKRLDNICNGGKIDLAYSSGLFDYVPTKFAPRITKALFDQLKVGGRLMIGNYLESNEYSEIHPQRQRFVMEELLDWKLIYRTKEEIKTFLDKIDPDTYTYHIANEYFGTNPNILNGSIGFLIAKKIK